MITLKVLGNNQYMVSSFGRELYFSYETCVAFRGEDGKLIVSENVWSRTTGKLLNELQPDKTLRHDYEEFSKRLSAFNVLPR